MSLTESVLEFADGERVPVAFRPGATVFEAARSGGIRLAHDCLAGTCATCKGTLVAGSVDYAVPTDDLALVPGRDDEVLACSARMQSPVHVRFDYTRASVIPAKKRKLRVTHVERQGTRVWRVLCRSERKIDFLPGQYVRVTPPGLAAPRAFSPASLPDHEVEFLIREVDQGAMSLYLAQRCAVGDVWEMTGPFGTFHRRHARAPALYVAGGTGLAPIVSLLREQQRLGAPQAPARLVFGVARAEELFYRDALAHLQREMPQLGLDICVGADAVPGAVRGTVLDAITASHVEALGADGVAYMCGPPGMLQAVRRTLQSFGLREDRLLCEEFVAS